MGAQNDNSGKPSCIMYTPGWGGDSMGKVSAVQAQVLKLGLTAPPERSGIVVPGAYMLKGWGDGVSPEHAGQPV